MSSLIFLEFLLLLCLNLVVISEFAVGGRIGSEGWLCCFGLVVGLMWFGFGFVGFGWSGCSAFEWGSGLVWFGVVTVEV